MPALTPQSSQDEVALQVYTKQVVLENPAFIANDDILASRPSTSLVQNTNTNYNNKNEDDDPVDEIPISSMDPPEAPVAAVVDETGFPVVVTNILEKSATTATEINPTSTTTTTATVPGGHHLPDFSVGNFSFGDLKFPFDDKSQMDLITIDDNNGTVPPPPTTESKNDDDSQNYDRIQPNYETENVVSTTDSDPAKETTKKEKNLTTAIETGMPEKKIGVEAPVNNKSVGSRESPSDTQEASGTSNILWVCSSCQEQHDDSMDEG